MVADYSDTSANEDNSFRNHSLAEIFVSRNVMLSGVSLLAVSNVIKPSRVGGSPLCDVVSSFLCHTHTDGKDELLEWPDRSCLLLYVSGRIH